MRLESLRRGRRQPAVPARSARRSLACRAHGISRQPAVEFAHRLHRRHAALQWQGGAVLVQRGWAPRGFEDRTRVPALATPEGVVRIEGRIAPPPSRLYEFDTAASGAIRQNVDPEAFGREIGVALAPVSVQQEGGLDARRPAARLAASCGQRPHPLRLRLPVVGHGRPHRRTLCLVPTHPPPPCPRPTLRTSSTALR